MAKLPLRFSILYVLNKAGDKQLTTKEIYDHLAKDYSGEGQFGLEQMELHLMAIKATGLIEGKDPYLDDNGDARYHYSITDYGRSRIKYLPKAYQS